MMNPCKERGGGSTEGDVHRDQVTSHGHDVNEDHEGVQQLWVFGPWADQTSTRPPAVVNKARNRNTILISHKWCHPFFLLVRSAITHLYTCSHTCRQIKAVHNFIRLASLQDKLQLY